MNKGIVIIPDFLEKSECDKLIGRYSAVTEHNTGIQNDLVPEWKKVFNCHISKESLLEKEIADIHSSIGETIIDEFKVSTATPREDGYFYKYDKGCFYNPHCDSQTVSTMNGDTIASRKPSSADVSSILYLNDNFVGGDLRFIFHGRDIRPKTGMLVLFYGGWENAHSVLPIEVGSRFCIVNWFITSPNLVPIADIIPPSHSHYFVEWEKNYQKIKS